MVRFTGVDLCLGASRATSRTLEIKEMRDGRTKRSRVPDDKRQNLKNPSRAIDAIDAGKTTGNTVLTREGMNAASTRGGLLDRHPESIRGAPARRAPIKLS